MMLGFLGNRPGFRSFAIPFSAEEREVWKFHNICRFEIQSGLPAVNRTNGVSIGAFLERSSYLACVGRRLSDAFSPVLLGPISRTKDDDEHEDESSISEFR